MHACNMILRMTVFFERLSRSWVLSRYVVHNTTKKRLMLSILPIFLCGVARCRCKMNFETKIIHDLNNHNDQYAGLL